MSILKKFRKNKTLSADVIALLAQAHEIHQTELEFARDEVRAELRQKIRDEVMKDRASAKDLMGRPSAAAAMDSLRIDVGLLFSDTQEQREEWVEFVKLHRVHEQNSAYEKEAAKIARANGRPLPYRTGDKGTHSSGGVVASW